MRVKRFGIMLSCAVLLLCALPVSASALESGVYTGSVITSYSNPDTGNVDDGGTSNAALGDGMCRSATGTAALVEVDGDDVWVTIRLLLQSSCSNVKLYTRTGYDSYSQVSYSITQEDGSNDFIDYRFKVSSAEVKLKATMYVTPMGRDVLWYLYIDAGTLAEGSGDFVVSIDTGKAEEPAETESPVSTPTPVPAAAPAGTAEPTPEAAPSQAPAPSAAPSDGAAAEAPESSDEPESTGEPEEAGEAADPDETDEPADTTESIDALNLTTDAGEPADDEAEEPDSADGEIVEDNKDAEDGGLSAGVIAGIVILAATAAVIAVIIVRRKAKR